MSTGSVADRRSPSAQASTNIAMTDVIHTATFSDNIKDDPESVDKFGSDYLDAEFNC